MWIKSQVRLSLPQSFNNFSLCVKSGIFERILSGVQTSTVSRYRMRLNQGSYRTACLVPTACVHTQDESQVFMAKPVVGQGGGGGGLSGECRKGSIFSLVFSSFFLVNS